MSSKLVLKNDIATEFKITHEDGTAARAIASTDLSYTRATVEELTALVGTNGEVCVLTDFNRGGTFVYDSAAVDNGGTVFGKWVRQYDGAVNVKWFGAKGDWDSVLLIGTDDTVAIQSAFNAFKQGEIYIPMGTYKISSTLEIPGTSGFTIAGESNGDERVDYTSGSALYAVDCHGISVANQGAGNQRVNGTTIKDLLIYGNDKDNGKYGIYDTGFIDGYFHGVLSLDNVKCAIFDIGLNIDYSGWLKVDRCSFQNNNKGANIVANVVNISNSLFYQNKIMDVLDLELTNRGLTYLETLPFGLKISCNSGNIVGCDFENNTIGLYITPCAYISTPQVSTTGSYFEHCTMLHTVITSSLVNFNSCYSNDNDTHFYISDSKCTFNACTKMELLSRQSLILGIESCYNTFKTEFVSLSSGTINDYTAEITGNILSVPGITKSTSLNEVSFGAYYPFVSELNPSIVDADYTLNESITYNSRERNSQTLKITATGGYGRIKLSSAITNGDFAVTTVIKTPSTWVGIKIYIDGVLSAGGTIKAHKDSLDISTVQLLLKGITATTDVHLYIVPGTGVVGDEVEFLDYRAYKTTYIALNDFLGLGQNTIRYSSGAPALGRHEQGEVVNLVYPDAGGTIGSVCTAGGSPGTWKTFGSIEA